MSQPSQPSSNASLGEVRELKNGYQIQFERHLRHPVERVWAALTTPGERAAWFAPGEIELAPGGRVALAFTDGKTVIDGEVTAYDPPHLLEFTWMDQGADRGIVRWELAPEPGGTHLRLTHTLTDGARSFGLPALAGWHTLLENMTVLLDGRNPVEFPDRWQEFHDLYAAQRVMPTRPRSEGETR